MTTQDRSPVHELSHGRRLWTCIAIGLLAGGLFSLSDLGWEFAVLVGWTFTSGVFLVWVWSSVHHLDALETAKRATREDDSRAEAGLALLAASTVSLIGVAVGLHHAATLKGFERAALTTLCIVTIAFSWTAVHTVFMLRYAHEYCLLAHGIDFGVEPPTFADFAYFAFTIGMTYQVSDTPITSRTIRRTATRQALLSFLFGTTILAVTINVVAGLVT
jgi:uncharacterized membrane protein